jgi:hypothetical protein
MVPDSYNDVYKLQIATVIFQSVSVLVPHSVHDHIPQASSDVVGGRTNYCNSRTDVQTDYVGQDGREKAV